MTKLKPKNLDEMTWMCQNLRKGRNCWVLFFWILLAAVWFHFIFLCSGCNENPASPGSIPTLSVASKYDVPQPIEPPPVPLVVPTDADWFEALRIYETKEDDWAIGDKGASRGAYQIQEGRWNDALDRLGIAHDNLEWRWELWFWSKPKSEYVLYSYWARFNLNTWEQRIKAHKGIKGIDNPSREVYYEHVKNLAWDLMRRKAVR